MVFGMVRMTQQRRAILDALEHAGRPLSPTEILEVAQITVPNLSLPTVYRNVKLLLEGEGIISVSVPGQPPRYELSGMDHHHHFLCKVCNRLYDLVGCPGSFAGLAPRGFTVQGHDLLLTGNCRSCKTAR
jgi:Fur family transcriptional regulator, ferric uptake regulator